METKSRETNSEIISGKEKRLKNLKPFKKGQSGNPKGLPFGQRNYATLYKEALIKLAKMNNMTPEAFELGILSKGLMNARTGDYRFYKDVLDRIHGTAINKTDITSEGKQIKGINYIVPNEPKRIKDND